MKEIKDIRIDFFDEDIQKEKDVELFMGDIALKFLIACKPLYLGDTEVLRVRIHSNISNMKWEDKINGINISRSQWYGNLSDVSTVFSLKLFQRLTDTMQVHYLVRIIYNLLHRLSKVYYENNLNNIINAYLSCIKNNFIFHSKTFKQKDVEAILCSCRYLKYTDYFLKLNHNTYFLTRKERVPLSIWQNYTLDEMLNTPQFFKGRWIKKGQLLLNWGEEKYIFNVNTEEIQKYEDDETTNKY